MTAEDIYNEFFARLQTGDVSEDLNTADVSVALLDASHSPDVANHAVFDDVDVDEISNTGASDDGYTAGGESIGNFSITADSGARTVDADGDDVTWDNSTIDAGYAVIYNAEPAEATDQDLIMLVDFEGEESSVDAEFTLEWDADGIYSVDTNPA